MHRLRPRSWPLAIPASTRSLVPNTFGRTTNAPSDFCLMSWRRCVNPHQTFSLAAHGTVEHLRPRTARQTAVDTRSAAEGEGQERGAQTRQETGCRHVLKRLARRGRRSLAATVTVAAAHGPGLRARRGRADLDAVTPSPSPSQALTGSGQCSPGRLSGPS